MISTSEKAEQPANSEIINTENWKKESYIAFPVTLSYIRRNGGGGASRFQEERNIITGKWNYMSLCHVISTRNHQSRELKR